MAQQQNRANTAKEATEEAVTQEAMSTLDVAKKEAEKAEKAEPKPNAIMQETKASVTHILEPEFDKAPDYKARLAVLQKMTPPITPEVAMNLIGKIDATREKALIFEVFNRMESQIDPKYTEQEGKCVFETKLMTADTQLEFIGKMDGEGLQDYVVPLLEHSASDEVRKAILDITWGQLPEDKLLLALKTTSDPKIMKMILQHAPTEGLSDEAVKAIKEDPKINAGTLGNIGVNSVAQHQSMERKTQTGPQAIAQKATSPFKKIFGWFGGLWGKTKNFFNGLIGRNPGATPPPKEGEEEKFMVFLSKIEKK